MLKIGKSAKKLLYKIGVCLLTFVVTFTLVLSNTMVLALENKQKNYEYLEDATIKEELKNKNLFYIGSQPAKINENSNTIYLFKVKRIGDLSNEASVKLNMIDVTAKYGDDYVIRTHGAGSEVIESENSSSMYEQIIEQNEEIEEYNDSDQFLEESNEEKKTENNSNLKTEKADDTSKTDEQDRESQAVYSEESSNDENVDINKNISLMETTTKETEQGEKENKDQTETNKNEKTEVSKNETEQAEEEIKDKVEIAQEEKVEAVKSEGEKSSLVNAYEAATGLESDREAMDGGNQMLTELENITQSLTFDIESAYLQLDFKSGEEEKIVEIEVFNNRKSDGDRTFEIVLGSLSENVGVGSQSTLIVNIIDDEEAELSNIYFSDTDYYVTDNYIEVTVRREGALNQTVGVKLYTENNSALSGTDYSAVETQLIFPLGIKERRIKIPVNISSYDDIKNFYLYLKEPIGTATITKGEAVGIISGSKPEVVSTNNNELTRNAEANQNSIVVGSELDLKKLASGGGAHDKGYSRANGSQWQLYAQDRDGFHNVSSWINFQLGEKRYDYSGIQVTWNRQSRAPNYGDTTVEFSQGNKSENSNFETVYRTDEGRWGTRSTNIFSSKDYIKTLFFNLYRSNGWLGTSPTLNIEKIQPIRRPFKITLKEAEPLQFLNDKGEYQKNTSFNNQDIKNANKTKLENATNSGSGYVIKFAGNDSKGIFTVTSSSKYSYIKGLKIVDSNGASKLIKSYNYGTTSASITVDQKFISENIDYISFSKNGNNGKMGSFSIQPVLGYYNVDLTLESDQRGKLNILTDNKTEISEVIDGNYFIKNIKTGKYLAPTIKDLNNFTNVLVKPDRYQWSVKAIGDGSYSILESSNKYSLDIDGASKSDGVNLQIYEKNNSDAQKFYLKRQSDGSYIIIAKCSDKAFTVQSNDNVNQMTNKKSDNQKWILEPANSANAQEIIRFHLGDNINVSTEVKDKDSFYSNSVGYEWTSANHNVTTGTMDYNKNKNYTSIFLEQPKLKLSSVYQEKDNQISLRIKTNELSEFDTNSGVLKGLKGKVNGEYTEYVLADKNSAVAGNMYEFSLYPKVSNTSQDINVDKSIKMVEWKIETEEYGQRNYSQNTLFYEAQSKPKYNVLYASIIDSDKELYGIKGTAIYSNESINGTIGNGYLPADNMSIFIGDYIGASSGEGKVSATFKGKNQDYVIYKTEASGQVSYETLQINNEIFNKKDEIVVIDNNKNQKYPYNYYDMGRVYVSSTPQDRPHVNSVYVNSLNSSMNGNNIYIDEKESYKFDIVTVNDGVKYSYEERIQNKDGTISYETKTAEEKITDVELVIYDSFTNEEKYSIKAKKKSFSKDKWEASAVFLPQDVSKYTASDRLYVRVTTNRKIGDGKSLDTKGKLVSNDAFQSTTYSPVFTDYTFLYANMQEPVKQDANFDTDMGFETLPLIGKMTAVFNVKKVNLTITPLEDNGMRIGIGAIPKSLGADSGANNNGTSDNGVEYGKTDFKKAFAGIKDFGKEVNSKSGIGMSNWGLYPVFGLYMDFGIKDITQDYDETEIKALEFFGGGVYLGITGNFKLTQYFAISFVPCYFGVTGNFNAFLSGGMKTNKGAILTPNVLLTEDNSIERNYTFVPTVQSDNVVQAYVGAGLNGTLGVRGGFETKIDYIWVPTITDKYPEYDPNGLKLSLDMKIWVDALLFTIPAPILNIAEAKYGYYADIEKKENKAGLKAENVKLRERNTKPSIWSAKEARNTRSSFEQSGTETLLTNGYDYADPQLIEMNNNEILMLFLDDDKSRSNLNRTTLKYSIYKNCGWSKPITIQNDGTADFEPNVIDAGDKVIISWTSRNPEIVMNDNISEVEYLKGMEVYTTTFDKNTHELGVIEQLTDDEFYDSNPQAAYDEHTGDYIVYYQKSEVGESFETSVNPTKNGSITTYMLYDGKSKSWQRDNYFDNEVANEEEEKELIEKWGGQRFLAAPIYDFGINDPNIIDFDVITYNSLAVYTYSIDEDNNMDTFGDRELFIQVYDFKNHKTFHPVRITNNNVTDAMPQLVRKGENTYLFWLEDNRDINYLSITDLISRGINNDGTIKEDYELGISKVFFENNDANITPTFGSYQAYVDVDNNLYIIWIQPTTNEDGKGAQEIFASAFIDSGKESGSSWSDGVQLTNSGVFNDQPAFVVTKDQNLIIVNNQYEQDLVNDDQIRSVDLVATTYNSIGSIEVVDVKYKNELPVPNSDLEVTARIKNTGLKPAEGYSIDVYEANDEGKGEKIMTLTSDSAILPSSSDYQTFVWKLPSEVKGKKLIFEAKEKGYSNISMFTSDSIQLKPYFEISDEDVVQKQDGLYLEATIRNVGNISQEEVGINSKLTVSRENIYFENQEEKVYLNKALDNLEPNESITLEIKLDVADEDMNKGYENMILEITDENQKELGEPAHQQVRLKYPMNLLINKESNLQRMNIDLNDTKELNASYSQDNYFKGGTITFISSNSDVASVENGVLKANAEGSTLITARVLPYGTTKTFEVVVNDSSNNNSNNGSENDITGTDTNKNDSIGNVNYEDETLGSDNNISLNSNENAEDKNILDDKEPKEEIDSNLKLESLQSEKNNFVWIIIIVSIVILGLLGGVYLLKNKKNNKFD